MSADYDKLAAEARSVIRKVGVNYMMEALVTIVAEDIFKHRENKDTEAEWEARNRHKILMKARDAIR